MVDVVVIGGGIAGLGAAYEMSKRGLSFVLLEKSARAGGVIVSEEVDGYTIDGGPDALLIQKPDGIKLCEEIGLGARLVPTKPPRLAFIQRRGRLYPLPSNSVLGIPTRVAPFVRTGLFTWAGKVRMGAELLVRARHDEADESIGGFMRRRFGDEAVDYLAEPLLAGIHAGDVDRLSVGSMFPRFVEAERRYGSLIRAFRADRRRRPEPSAGVPRSADEGAFKSLPGGLSEMVRALVAVLPAASIRLEAPVAAVRQTTTGFGVAVSSGESVAARAVIVSAPAYAAADLLRELDPTLAGWCGEVPYSSTATIAMAFRRTAVAHPLNGSGFVVPRVERTGIMAATWLSSKWPGRAPADRALIRAFVGGARDPGALDRTDAELVRTSMSALTPLLGIAGEPLLTRVYRFNRASAQHEVGHRARLASIESALARIPGLFVTGSGFRGVGIPDCIADARATAGQVADWLARSHERSPA